MSWCAWQLPREFIARISDAEHVRKLRDDLYEALQDNHSLGQWPGRTTIARWKQRSIIRWQHRLKREHPTCTVRTSRSPKNADGRVAASVRAKEEWKGTTLAQSAEAISQRAIRVGGCRFTKSYRVDAIASGNRQRAEVRQRLGTNPRDLSVTLRPFGRLLLCLLVFLH
jgi:hypothetical protein